MRIPEIIRRELEIVFAKDAQPVWFRIAKYLLLALLIYLFWGSKIIWIIILTIVTFSLMVHFWFRYKTNGWTTSYGPWKMDKAKRNHPNSK